MKIAEKLSDLQRKESELNRLYNLRDTILSASFKDSLINTEISSKEIDSKQKKFVAEQVKEVCSLEAEIENLQKSIIDGRNKINKINIENGIDKKIAEIKWIRIELAKLMKLIAKEDRYSFSSSTRVDKEILDNLGINDRIKDLEKKKSKIDSEIQEFNWSHKI